MNGSLEGLVRELEDVAARLRSEGLPPEEAAELVERCAELARLIGAELDREARAAERDSPIEGQGQLL